MSYEQAIEYWDAKALWDEQNEGSAKFNLKAHGALHGGNTYTGRRNIEHILYPVTLTDEDQRLADNIIEWRNEGYSTEQQINLQKQLK